MTFNLTVKINIITTVFVLVALQANVKQCSKEITLYIKSQGADEITNFEKRFRELKKVLPPCGFVGYVTDEKLTAKEFSLTQYALFPIIVERNKEHNLIVGNFRDPSINSEFFAEQNLKLLDDFGNGIMLFTRRAK